jgi:hypothetical protein
MKKWLFEVVKDFEFNKEYLGSLPFAQDCILIDDEAPRKNCHPFPAYCTNYEESLYYRYASYQMVSIVNLAFLFIHWMR